MPDHSRRQGASSLHISPLPQVFKFTELSCLFISRLPQVYNFADWKEHGEDQVAAHICVRVRTRTYIHALERTQKHKRMRMHTRTHVHMQAAVKEAGKYRQEGKNYLVKDKDIIFFKFNVTADKKK